MLNVASNVFIDCVGCLWEAGLITVRSGGNLTEEAAGVDSSIPPEGVLREEEDGDANAL